MLHNVHKIYVLPLLFYVVCAFVLYHVVDKQSGHFDVDSYGYIDIAQFFAQTGILTDPHCIASPPVQPVGYHFFLGILLRIFNGSMALIIGVQILCMCLVIVCSIYLARILYGDVIAWIVGMLSACNIGYLVYAQLILAEVILLLLLMLFFLTYVYFLRDKRIGYVKGAGFFLGISMLIKPVVLLFIIPVAYVTYRVSYITYVLMLMIYFMMPIGIYILRNYVQYGAIFFAPMTELNLYQCFLAKVMSAVDGGDEQIIIENKLRFNAQSLADSSGWSHARYYFHHYIWNYPYVCSYIWLCNIFKTWFGLYATQLKKMVAPCQDIHSFFRQNGSLYDCIQCYITGGTDSKAMAWLSWINVWYDAIRLFFACLGLVVLYKRAQTMQVVFFLSWMMSMSIVTGIDGCCRYRLTYEPILLLLASIGLAYIVLLCKKSKGVYVCHYI